MAMANVSLSLSLSFSTFIAGADRYAALVHGCNRGARPGWGAAWKGRASRERGESEARARREREEREMRSSGGTSSRYCDTREGRDCAGEFLCVARGSGCLLPLPRPPFPSHSRGIPSAERSSPRRWPSELLLRNVSREHPGEPRRLPRSTCAPDPRSPSLAGSRYAAYRPCESSAARLEAAGHASRAYFCPTSATPACTLRCR
jgi:hypothetical protein